MIKTTAPKPKPASRKHPVDHFSISQKMGFSPYLHCWCGKSLEMRYKGKPIESAMSVFREAHEECKPVGAETASVTP